MDFTTVLITGMLLVICYLLYTMSQSRDESTRAKGTKFTEWLLMGYGLMVVLGVVIGALVFIYGLGILIFG